MQRYGLEPDQALAPLSHATTVVTNAILEQPRRPRRPHHHARLPRRPGAEALRPGRSLRSLPGCAGHPRSRAATASRSPSASAPTAPWSRRWPIPRSTALIATLKAARVEARRRRPALQLPQSRPRAPAGSASARRAAGHHRLSLLRVLPEIKEFQRTSTTAVCAYVGPILASYLVGSRRRRAARDCRRSTPWAPMAASLRPREAVAMPAMAVELGRPPARLRRPWWPGRPGAATFSPSTWAARRPRPA